MKTKKLLMAGVLISCSFVTFGQENPADNKDEVRIRKQTVVTDLETQIRDVPFAAVRVCARYRIASWLWKNAKDDTGRAEDVARAALEDHYKNKGEIPQKWFCNAQLFVLLDAHAKDVAKQLREKYKASEDESAAIIDSLGQKGGEKQAVDAAVRMLSRQNEKSPDLVYLLMTLEQRGSPELTRLLGAILAADDAGRTRFPTHMIEILTGFFIKPDVPGEMRKHFIRLVLARSRNVAALSVLDQGAYYRTIQRLWPDISTKYPEMVAEAGTVHALLSAQASRSTREANERYERLQNSSDKLAATVAEAERAEDARGKYSLYRSAARLALEKKKFVYAVDLMEKASEIDITASGISTEFSKNLHHEFYRDVAIKALEVNEPDGANHAVKKMNVPLAKAEALRNISKYYIDKNDLESGRSAHDEAIKLISGVDSSPDGIATAIRMMPTANKIGPIYMSELSQIIAKKINAIPSLNVEDKPDTKNYRDYVTNAMTINLDLRPALIELVKVNRNAAADLASRIEKKEIRIIADYVLLTDSIDSLSKQKKSLESAMLPSK